MKVQMILISILIILAGILPFLGQSGLKFLPAAIPTAAPGYSFIILVLYVRVQHPNKCIVKNGI